MQIDQNPKNRKVYSIHTVRFPLEVSQAIADAHGSDGNFNRWMLEAAREKLGKRKGNVEESLNNVVEFVRRTMAGGGM